MHGAASSPGITGGLSEKLRHHAFHIGPFGNAVAMAAMGGDDIIIGPQGGARPYRHRFLPDVGVKVPAYETTTVHFHAGLLKTPYHADFPVHGNQKLFIRQQHFLSPVCNDSCALNEQ